MFASTHWGKVNLPSCQAEDLAPCLYKTQNTGAVSLERFYRHCRQRESFSSIVWLALDRCIWLVPSAHGTEERSSGSPSPQSGCEGQEGRWGHSICRFGCLLVEEEGPSLLDWLVQGNPVHAERTCFLAPVHLTAMPSAGTTVVALHVQGAGTSRKEKVLTSNGSWYLCVIGNKIND